MKEIVTVKGHFGVRPGWVAFVKGSDPPVVAWGKSEDAAKQALVVMAGSYKWTTLGFVPGQGLVYNHPSHIESSPEPSSSETTQ